MSLMTIKTSSIQRRRLLFLTCLLLQGREASRDKTPCRRFRKKKAKRKRKRMIRKRKKVDL